MTRTVVAEAYGGPEVLALQDIELPAPGAGQVLVDVRAAGTNPIDFKLYSGDMGRDAANLPMPLGMEVAGIVVAAAQGAPTTEPHDHWIGRRRRGQGGISWHQFTRVRTSG